MATKAFATITTDGAAGAFKYAGGVALIQCAGTWDGALIHLQVSADGGTTYTNLRDENGFAADGAAVFDLPVCWIRLNASNTGASTDVDVSLLHGLSF
jgi:hypothetical protein